MTKIYQFFYSIDGFEKSKENIIDVQTVFNQNFGDYGDVFKVLKKVQLSPKQETINRILDFSRKEFLKNKLL
jgi:hypothetical protein